MKLDWLWIVYIIVVLAMLGCPKENAVSESSTARKIDTTKKEDSLCLKRRICPEPEPPRPPGEM